MNSTHSDHSFPNPCTELDFQGNSAC